MKSIVVIAIILIAVFVIVMLMTFVFHLIVFHLMLVAPNPSKIDPTKYQIIGTALLYPPIV